MTAPATTKVMQAVLGVLEAAEPTINFFIERSDEEALDESQLPAVTMRLLNIGFDSTQDQGQWYWSATLQFDCQSTATTALTIDGQNQLTIAKIIAALWDSHNTAGGALNLRLQECEPEGADSSEQSAPDVGWAVLQYRILYFTPPGDPFTIVGPGGQQF